MRTREVLWRRISRLQVEEGRSHPRRLPRKLKKAWRRAIEREIEQRQRSWKLSTASLRWQIPRSVQRGRWRLNWVPFQGWTMTAIQRAYVKPGQNLLPPHVS